MNHTLSLELEQRIKQLNFDGYQWIKLKQPLHFEFYKTWIENNHHAGMDYLKTQIPLRETPQTWAPFAQSVLVFQKSYLNHPWPNPHKRQALKVARYSQGFDYHLQLKEELNQIINLLRDHYPEAQFLAVTDSTPLMERDLGYQAGLGWYGRNTCLINPREGSFFLLGEILTSIDITLPTIEPMADFCGKCQACITACPTQALDTNKTLNANQCLAYWNIESQELPPEPIRTKMQDLFFGCDICQDVCPWNHKPLKLKTPQPLITPTSQEIADELTFFLTASNRDILKSIENTPLTRARPFGLRRNAIIVATNLKLAHLWPEIESCCERYPRLLPLKDWSQKQFAPSDS